MDKSIVDESLDSGYKLIKYDQGKISAEYIGTPPKNGFYKRQFWVQKGLVEKLPANHTMQGKSSVPPKHFYSLEERNDSLDPKTNAPPKEYYRVGRYAYRHRNDNAKIAYSHFYPNLLKRNFVYGVLDGPSCRYNLVRYEANASSSASLPSQSPARLRVIKNN